MNTVRAATAEFAGAMFLLMAVVGSGIMAERLAHGDVAVALLANTLATCATLCALIATFGPYSGAHFNPAVSLAMALRGRLAKEALPLYMGAQFAGAVMGVWCAHLMFDVSLLDVSSHARAGFPQALSEFVATFGLVTVIWSLTENGTAMAPLYVAAYIAGAYWFTASTSFANPAVSFARAWTDTFAGIQPWHVPAFVLAQFLGALAATAFFQLLEKLPRNGA